ncbi:MAG: ATP-binding protein, partial [Solirubrobacteraceae bacterium]
RYPVSPLALPQRGTLDDPEALACVDAVALFTERARAHDPEFSLTLRNAAAVAEICQRVDGLPLAIELAAARCGMLSPDEIAARLHNAPGALGPGARDAPARQQTLRATIDWSHNLLSDPEKKCFARFAVFAGGATIDAAETVTQTGLDTLDGLVAKSLLVRRHDTDAPTRLRMLETIRAYATERFALAADKDAIHERHYRYYLTVAERHGTERALWGPAGTEHLTHLDAEIGNLHAALGWAVARANAGQALAMCAALRLYWAMRDRPADAIDWVEQARHLPGADAHPAAHVDALEAMVFGLRQLGRPDDAASVLAEAEAVARDLGDPAVLSYTLERRAVREAMDGRLDAADALADEAAECAATAKEAWAIANAAFAKALAAPRNPELRERIDRAASLLEDAGNIFRLAGLYSNATYAALCNGSDREAKEFIDSALRIARDSDHPFTWMSIHGNLGLAALLTGDSDAARRAFHEELAVCRELVARPYDIESLRGLAAVAAVRGDVDRAARLVGAAAAHRYGQPKDPIDARLDATFFDPARRVHRVDRWNAAARDGGSLSFEDAIAYALEEPPTQIRAHSEAAT